MWRYDIVLGEMNWNTVVCFTMVKQTKIVRQIWVPYPAKKYHDLMGCLWNRLRTYPWSHDFCLWSTCWTKCADKHRNWQNECQNNIWNTVWPSFCLKFWRYEHGRESHPLLSLSKSSLASATTAECFFLVETAAVKNMPNLRASEQSMIDWMSRPLIYG